MSRSIDEYERLDHEPRKDSIEKLPVWAQDLIIQLCREREEAIKHLNDFVDSQTESDIYCDQWAGTREGGSPGPVTKRHYIQSNSISIDFEGVRVEVLLRAGQGVDITFGASRVNEFWIDYTDPVLMQPRSTNQIYLMSPNHFARTEERKEELRNRNKG